MRLSWKSVMKTYNVKKDFLMYRKYIGLPFQFGETLFTSKVKFTTSFVLMCGQREVIVLFIWLVIILSLVSYWCDSPWICLSAPSFVSTVCLEIFCCFCLLTSHNPNQVCVLICVYF